VTTAEPGEIKRLPGLQVTWAEIRWAARNEAVQHLDDLLLRPVRLGLLAPRGAEWPASTATAIRA
jgi:glycerol-3-phosphate dehydrogenase